MTNPLKRYSADNRKGIPGPLTAIDYGFYTQE